MSIFKRVGIGDLTYLTFASGGSFSKFSHEFQAITSAGEDTIYIDEKSKIAVNKEVYIDEILKSLNFKKDKLIEKKSIEVGNIFSLGTKFSEPFDLKYKNEKGEENLVIMGSYGIGLGRLMGAVVEILSDDKGLIWPVSIAPFKVHIVELTSEKNKVKETSEKLYNTLVKSGIEVLYDDRESRAGEKFNDSDLIGIPIRIVVSDKGLEKGEFEIKQRIDGKVLSLKEKEILDFVNKYTN